MNGESVNDQRDDLWLEENLRPLRRACRGGTVLGAAWIALSLWIIWLSAMMGGGNVAMEALIIMLISAGWGIAIMGVAHAARVHRGRGSVIALLVLSLLSAALTSYVLFLGLASLVQYGLKRIDIEGVLMYLVVAIFSLSGWWAAGYCIVSVRRWPRSVGQAFEVLPGKGGTQKGAD